MEAAGFNSDSTFQGLVTEHGGVHFSLTQRGNDREVFTNDAGESLRVCLDKYGVSVKDYDEMGVTTVVLFLTGSKTHNDSWLLASTIGGEPIRVKYYEADPFTYHLSSNTDLGAMILDRLNC